MEFAIGTDNLSQVSQSPDRRKDRTHEKLMKTATNVPRQNHFALFMRFSSV
jgi:hypothetical protein